MADDETPSVHDVWLYHPTHGARLFTSDNLPPEGTGWVDTPAKFPPEATSEATELLAMAVAELDPENSEHWTKDGKPTVEALEAVSGTVNISASERDQAWAMVEEARANAG